MTDRTARGAPRLALLDALRFVAAAAVLAYHFTALNGPFRSSPSLATFPQLHTFTRYGYLGVELFFFISGFVILMTAWGRTLPDFTASRVARLYPAYWVAVLLSGVLVLTAGKALITVRPSDVLVNLTMLQQGLGVRHVDGAYWTLWVELRFYVLVAVFMLVGITRTRILAVCFAWPLLAGMAATAKFTFLADLLVAPWAPFFAAGMLLYLVHREGLDLVTGLLAGMNLLLALHQSALTADALRATTGAAGSQTVAMAVVLAAYLAVAAVTCTPLARVRWRWATSLGALTYPLYVIHERWGHFVILSVQERVGPYQAVLLAAAVSLALAVAIRQLVEKPLSRPLRRAVRRGLSAGTAGDASKDAAPVG